MIRGAVRTPARSSGRLKSIRKAALPLLWQALSAFLLSRARIAGGLAPFAPACAAAGLLHGWNPAALLAGCALGCLTSGVTELDMLPLFSCAAGCALHLTVRALDRFIPPQPGMRDFLAGCCAFFATLAPGLCFSGGIVYNVLTAFLSAAAAGLLAPALMSALSVTLRRRQLMPEEQLSLALYLMILLISLRAVPRAGVCLAPAAAVLCLLIASGAGAGMGAMAGVASGAALALGGGDPFCMSVLGLCGLIAGCMRTAPRPVACMGVFLSSLLTVSGGMGFEMGAVSALSVLLGGGAYCLIPKKLLRRIRGWLKTPDLRADPGRTAVRLRRKAGRRLGEIGDVFGELADGYGEQTYLPDEKALMTHLRNSLCAGCGKYAACWQGDRALAGRLLCRMAAEAIAGKDVTPAGELPPDLIRHCRRSAQIDRKVTPFLKELASARDSELKRSESRGLMARQFREVQRLMDALSTQLTHDVCLNPEYAQAAAAALDRAGLPARDVLAVLDDRIEIVCTLRRGAWNAEKAHRAADYLSDELGVPMSPVVRPGGAPGECELRLMQAPALTASIGVAKSAAQADGPSGDAFVAFVLPDGRMIAAISDGMGSGEAAARESARCISLLRKFVSAGVEREASLSAVNSLMLMKGGEEMFATLDLCVTDLYTGVASFSKLGACRSFILGAKGVRQVTGGRLPLGILDRVEPETTNVEVHPGDMIVMTSDGVADELREGQTEALLAALPGVRHMSSQDAADFLLRWAQTREGEKDDMTVIAARILARPLRCASLRSAPTQPA